MSSGNRTAYGTATGFCTGIVRDRNAAITAGCGTVQHFLGCNGTGALPRPRLTPFCPNMDRGSGLRG